MDKPKRRRDPVERVYRECVSCGRMFRTGTNYECSACRTIDRECTTCGKTFRGTARRCRACQATERTCTGCGRTFEGTGSRCRPCQATERTCTECGQLFRGGRRKCFRCWYAGKRQRQCETCGHAFHGWTRRCSACLATERTCTECGETFRGRYQKCPACRRFLKHAERTCTECGCPFRGDEYRCWPCRATDRVCTGCGSAFRGYGRKCAPCRVAAQDPEVRAAQNRRLLNVRRARKRGAEICGPVPTAVYERLQAQRCVYCHGPGGTVDHIWPLARGGWEHESNLAPACTSCNCSKNDRLLTEWLPERVAHGVAHSAVVAAEYARLTGATLF